MKQCPKCNATYSDDFEFCTNDGMNLFWLNHQGGFSNQPFSPSPPNFPTPAQFQNVSDNNKGKFLVIGLIAGFFLLLGIGGTLFFIKYQEQNDKVAAENSPNISPTPGNSNTENSPVPTPTPTPTPDKAQLQRLINEKIKSILKKEELEESGKQYRKIIYGDLDGDGDEDAVVHYTWNFIGGNGWGLSLMAFTSENGEFTFAANEVIGGKDNRSTELKSIKNGKIHIATTSYDEDDASCCPSIKGNTTYQLKGNKLVGGK